MQPTSNSSKAIVDKNSKHLPRQNERQVLRDAVDQYLTELSNKPEHTPKIDILKLRKRLLATQGLNMERIDNLESIFLYYCTQVFKTANKQITFERMEYEKTHLTMERFFAFLKDFNLTTATIENTLREIVDKNEIVLLFKKASINCKDVNFEQFLALLEKIAVLYHDSKGNYKQKMQQIARERQKRKENNLKNQQRRKAALEAAKQQLTRGGEKQEKMDTDNDDKETVQEEKQEEKREEKEQQQQNPAAQNEQHQNDHFVTALMNDKTLEDPQRQFNAQLEMTEENAEQAVDISQPLQQPPNIHQTDTANNNQEELLLLTAQEKIQYFYQMIDVDDNASFRKKMKQLNMELLHTKTRKVSAQIQKARDVQTPEDSTDQRRLEEIRARLKEKEEKDKKDRSYSHISPRPTPEPKQHQITKRKPKEELDIGRKHPPKSKKIELNDLSIDLSSLSKISSDQINFGKFNPKKFTNEQTDPYLDDYFSVNQSQRNEKRVLSHLQSNDRAFELIQEKLKRRTEQLQLLDKSEETKYALNQNTGGAGRSQSRKNRLLEKLVKLQRE